LRIRFYTSSSGRSPIEKFIEGLAKEDQAKFNDVFEGITANGLEFAAVEFRHLQGKLWKIKFKAKGGGYRVIYVMIEQDLMVWLHAFKKDSQKTPREELDLAQRRMKEVL
jgi:phage-related protein